MGLVVFWLFFLLVSSCVCGAVAGSIADKRGASYGGYFALGFFFGLIGIIAAAFAGNGGRQVTVVNNYYAVNPDGSHTRMTMGASGGVPLPGLAGPSRRVSAARSDMDTRACGDEACSGVGIRTSNLVCRVCRKDTVLGWTAPPPRPVLEAAPATRFDATVVPVTPRGPAHLLTRRCTHWECPESTALTSNLVCRACRRDTAAVSVV